jgi:hypothetical protein
LNNLAISENLAVLRQFRGKALWTALATLFDAEGCIVLNKSTANQERSQQYIMRLQVANTNMEWLESWARRIGRGNTYFYPSTNPKHSAYGYWCIQKKADVVYILKKILPYLIIKKEQARLLIEFTQGKFTKGNGQGPSGQELARRERIFQRMRVLNKRGPSESVETIRQTSRVEDDIVPPMEPSMELDVNVLALSR